MSKNYVGFYICVYIYIHDMLLKPKRKRDLTVYPVKGDMQSYATEATIESLYDTWIFKCAGPFLLGWFWIGMGNCGEVGVSWLATSLESKTAFAGQLRVAVAYVAPLHWQLKDPNSCFRFVFSFCIFKLVMKLT